jgi:hypothetical protein
MDEITKAMILKIVPFKRTTGITTDGLTEGYCSSSAPFITIPYGNSSGIAVRYVSKVFFVFFLPFQHSVGSLLIDNSILLLLFSANLGEKSKGKCQDDCQDGATSRFSCVES